MLLGYRDPARVYYPDCWDVPGGHIEPGESGRAALQRELREEIGIEIESAPAAADFRLLGEDYDLMLWIVRTWRGEVANRAPEEHIKLGWFAADELPRLRLADARYVGVLSAALNSPDN